MDNKDKLREWKKSVQLNYFVLGILFDIIAILVIIYIAYNIFVQ